MPHREPELPRQPTPPEPVQPPRPDALERQPSPSRREDLLIATMAGLLAWVITLALKTAFSY
jgi:hypothetical protein